MTQLLSTFLTGSGPTGPTGSTGPSGPASTVTGPTGPTGAAGAASTVTGPTGPAGAIPAFVSSSVAPSPGVNVPGGTTTDITSISLTAGSWLIYANIGYIPTGGSLTDSQAWVSSVSATAPSRPNGGAFIESYIAGTSGNPEERYVGSMQVSPVSTTTYYLSTVIHAADTSTVGFGYLAATQLVGANGPTGPTGPGSADRQVVVTVVGKPTASAVYQAVLSKPGYLYANAAGSVGSCLTNPTASWVFTLSTVHSGTVTGRGNITISTSGAFTFPTFSLVSLVAGDSIRITAPATPDTTGSDVSFNILYLST